MSTRTSPSPAVPPRGSGAEIEKKVHQYLDLVGMRDAEQSMPQELSGGMKRKVAIARR